VNKHCGLLLFNIYCAFCHFVSWKCPVSYNSFRQLLCLNHYSQIILPSAIAMKFHLHLCSKSKISCQQAFVIITRCGKSFWSHKMFNMRNRRALQDLKCNAYVIWRPVNTKDINYNDNDNFKNHSKCKIIGESIPQLQQ